MKPWMQYLIAFVVFCLRIGSVLPAPDQGWSGRATLSDLGLYDRGRGQPFTRPILDRTRHGTGYS